MTSAKAFGKGVLSEALAPAERGRLGVWLYDRSARYRDLEAPPWEPSWLDSRLPRAPASVLVGGCGAGREVLDLLARGYVVHAFDPAESMVTMARARSAGRAAFAACSYEDLSRSVLDGARGPAAPLAGLVFDAVLLGWGSLSHVLDGAERVRLVRALEILCPHGPILASALQLSPAGLPPRSRFEELGASLGRRFAGFRRLPAGDRGLEIAYDDLGFAHVFTVHELEALAARIRRVVVLEEIEEKGTAVLTMVRPNRLGEPIEPAGALKGGARLGRLRPRGRT